MNEKHHFVGLRAFVFRTPAIPSSRKYFPAQIRLPLIDAGSTETGLMVKLGDRCAYLVLYQDTDGLFFCEIVALHSQTVAIC